MQVFKELTSNNQSQGCDDSKR